MKRVFNLFVLVTLLALNFSAASVTPTYAAGETYALTVSGTYNYLSGNPAMDIATGLTATSTPAGGTIDGAIVLIGSGFQAGDVLSATDSGGVTSSYDAVSGVLTLSGTADVSVYQTVLGSVQFSSSSPNAGARTVTYSLGLARPYASTGHFFEYVDSGLMNWTAAETAAAGRSYFGLQGYLATINDAGENAFATTKLNGHGAWLGGSDAVTEGTWKWVTGPEAGTTFCVSTGTGPGNCPAEVGWFTGWSGDEPNNGGGFGEHYLQFWPGGNGDWNDLPDVGIDTYIEGYVVEYGGMPGDTPMSIQGSVTVNVSDTYDLTVSGTYNYISGDPAMDIATGLTATSTPAGGTIDGAIVLIGDGFQAGDVLSATDSGGVTSSYDAVSGVLTLSGTADVSVYQTVLGSVQFSSSSPNAGARTVTYSLGLARPYEATGHFFEYVQTGLINWTAAETAAAGRTYFGMQGYLATINDAGENAFATTKLNGQGAWLGGSDAATEGTWKWVTGPEAGTTFCISTGPGVDNCPAEAGWFTNWNADEPNNTSGLEHYLQFVGGDTGLWNDIYEHGLDTNFIQGYVVEYGGMPGDTPMFIQGSVTVNVSIPVANTAPVANNETYATKMSVAFTGATVLGNDTDADLDTLTATLGTPPAHASAFTFNADGTFDYEPENGYQGTDTFTYVANDGTADSNVATVSVSITPLTMTFYSLNTLDGWVSESSETSGQGGDFVANGILRVGDTALDQQYRSFLSFNASAVPADAVIVDARVMIKYFDIAGVDPSTTHGPLIADVRTGFFGSTKALAAEDFNAPASKVRLGIFRLAPNSTIWWSMLIRPADYQYVNTGGITQFRIRFETDDDNDNIQDWLRFASGNNVTATQPRMIVAYYIPHP